MKTAAVMSGTRHDRCLGNCRPTQNNSATKVRSPLRRQPRHTASENQIRPQCGEENSRGGRPQPRSSGGPVILTAKSIGLARYIVALCGKADA